MRAVQLAVPCFWCRFQVHDLSADALLLSAGLPLLQSALCVLGQSLMTKLLGYKHFLLSSVSLCIPSSLLLLHLPDYDRQGRHHDA